MPATSRRRRIAAWPLAGLLLPALAAAALAPKAAWANNRSLQGTPVPASACVEYRRSPGLTEDTWTGGFFQLTGEGFLELRCAWPVNNVDPSGTTNHLTKLRVHYRDSDAFGGGAGVQVVINKVFASAAGQARLQTVCFWASNGDGTGATTTAKATLPCTQDLAAGTFYVVDVFMAVVGVHTVQFLGVDFPP
jgi:hypothetical protein